MVELCTWADFSLSDIEGFQACSSNREDLKEAFCEKLGLQCAHLTKQQLIEIDLYVYAFLFGLKQEFSSAQLSTLLSIVKKLHELCISTAFDNQSQVLSYFQELVVRHSINRSPFSICIFSPNEVKSINEYVLSTYFKHFKLYKYAFTRKVHLNMSLLYAGEVIPPEMDSDQDATVESLQETMEQEDGLNERPSEGQTDAEPANAHLKELIISGLNKVVQQEQDRLQVQLAAQESRLLNRIKVVEAAVDDKDKRPKTNSAKKKSGKTVH